MEAPQEKRRSQAEQACRFSALRAFHFLGCPWVSHVRYCEITWDPVRLWVRRKAVYLQRHDYPCISILLWTCTCSQCVLLSYHVLPCPTCYPSLCRHMWWCWMACRVQATSSNAQSGSSPGDSQVGQCVRRLHVLGYTCHSLSLSSRHLRTFHFDARHKLPETSRNIQKPLGCVFMCFQCQWFQADPGKAEVENVIIIVMYCYRLFKICSISLPSALLLHVVACFGMLWPFSCFHQPSEVALDWSWLLVVIVWQSWLGQAMDGVPKEKKQKNKVALRYRWISFAYNVF